MRLRAFGIGARTAALVTIGMAALGGCGSSGAPRHADESASTTSPTPTVVAGCATLDPWRPVGGVRVHAAQLGAGRTVVLANDSGNSACDWMPLAEALVHSNFRVIVFEYFDASESGAARDALKLGKSDRAGRFALLGASVGGRIVIEAASRHPHGLAAIVSLSGERQIAGSYPDIIAQARRVASPALYVGADDDYYTQGRSQQLELHHAMHGHPNHLLQVPGENHGTDLLSVSLPSGQTIAERVVAFLRRQRH